jgi:predicted anti-sigma-YlaC factor YlaD
MNCKECLKLLDTYFDGKLHGEMELEVREHLDSCIDCASEYRQMVIAYRIIKEEKKMQPNPFLSTRVMSHIETIGKRQQYKLLYPF